jgi:UDP-N-acetylmuramate dehydrogenase
MDIKKQLQTKLGSRLIFDEPLKNHTSFKIGGPAKYFYVAEDQDDLIKVLKAASDFKVKTFLLGDGSNILVSDRGFDGLVIKIGFSEFEIYDSTIRVSAGMKLAELLNLCIKNKLSGLEFLAGIPASVGGAIWSNAGGVEESIGDYVETVTVLNKNYEAISLSQRECEFSYRQSRFQKSKEIVLSVELKLKTSIGEEVKKRIQDFMQRKTQIQPMDFPSAGCVFKNPPGHSAGELIDRAGLKGKTIGQAQVSEKHANYIINLGGATAEQVIILISLIKQKIRTKYNIQLQEEIKLVGF